MFEKARLKLTAWYLLIIMLVSIIFSLVVYNILTREVHRAIRAQSLRFRAPRQTVNIPREVPSFGFFQDIMPFGELEQLSKEDQKIFEGVEQRIALRLVFINISILLFSGVAGYFLAGRTLKPIEEMIDQQRRFIADASHELRTPLTAIKTESEVAMRDQKLNLMQAKKLLESNLEEVDKLKSLTDYFLTLSRFENPETKLNLETFNLAQAITQACEKLKVLATRRKIKIIKKLENIDIKADKSTIIQLVTILVDNAIKYSRPTSKIKITTYKKGKKAIIKIEDHGIGIKASDLPFIFNRFFRADSSRTKVGVDGYGLGLAIAKSIVELHDGSISVESEQNKGTKFTIALPLR
jgi:signal transduction histidine kinase